MTSQVLVIGSANADLVVPVDRRPAGGETVLGGDTVLSPGGKGANTAVAAARLGADVALLGAVGDDPYGELLERSLAESGVHTGRLRTSERPTGIAYITVTPDGENSILVSPGANSSVRPEDVDLDGAEIVVLSLEIPLETVEHAVAKAAEAGVRTLLNLSPAAELSAETLQNLDVLLVNEHEAAFLLGGEANFPKLLDLGPKAAVVTLGAKGAAVVTADGVVEVASPKVDAVDTTGAGDAFAGALATSLAKGEELADAARRAVKVAAITVTRQGAQPSYPKASELE
ncbi:ribokinase [Amycolatopsis regifaucium]|uniref:Ribokinase n=1 Tax=Amycolatopsis regifaucium TaxID=546365 RepID=A0A154MLL3_9PSEU|nr:ribokinase [Amycolatopsis regifaucium]KZB84930.1 ribokinase [Amycolatopsis regifaucium]OKA03947.1 ribokinase [Amycolatopsis regifaucium]SFH99890.1 ribokinase [Amycolatopsis regifaucium]